MGMRRTVGRASKQRPVHAPRSFVCPRCDFVLYDGVDYRWCPRCSWSVDWVDLARPLWCCASCDAFVNEARAEWPWCEACELAMARVYAREEPPEELADEGAADRSPPRRSRWAAPGVKLLLGAQVAILSLDPLGFVLAAPLLMMAVFAAVALLIMMLGSLGELQALARDQRTRVLHGLEHACIRLLQRRRCTPLSGQTHTGFFEVDVANDGRASVEAVEQATELAIARVASGDAALALHPQCGTSLMVGLVMVSLLLVVGGVAGLVAGLELRMVTAGMALASLLAWWGSRPLGIWVQRRLTVSTRFADAEVQHVKRVVHASGKTATFLVYVAVKPA
jgi:hypothetical protein